VLTVARLRAVLAAHGVHLTKGLGQHFLAVRPTALKIARLAATRPELAGPRTKSDRRVGRALRFAAEFGRSFRRNKPGQRCGIGKVPPRLGVAGVNARGRDQIIASLG